MRPLQRLAFALTASLFAACSNGATSSTPAVTVANIASSAKLQFGVGVATINSSNGVTYGTNFVSTFRGPDGHSAVLANTPTITGPASFVIGFAGSLNSVSGLLPNVLSQALIANQNGAPFPQSFGAGLGPLVGVFGYGMAADNLVSVQVETQLGKLQGAGLVCQDLASVSSNNVQPPLAINAASGVTVPISSEAQSNELGLPVGSGLDYAPANSNSGCPVDANSTNANIGIGGDFPINYYGGPPAWPSPQGYGSPTYFVGYPLGFTDFPAAPVVGHYSLDVAYATNTTSTTYAHVNASAMLTNATPLPPLTISNAIIHADGSGSVSLTIPPGLFETIVMVRANNCADAAAVKANYAIVTHSAGPQSIVFDSHLGPPDATGAPSATFCGFNGTADAVGFDYPAYESSYPFDLTQTPKITNGDGHTGQADVTTSAPVTFVTGP